MASKTNGNFRTLTLNTELSYIFTNYTEKTDEVILDIFRTIDTDLKSENQVISISIENTTIKINIELTT
jgi:hypothetical protein